MSSISDERYLRTRLVRPIRERQPLPHQVNVLPGDERGRAAHWYLNLRLKEKRSNQAIVFHHSTAKSLPPLVSILRMFFPCCGGQRKCLCFRTAAMLGNRAMLSTLSFATQSFHEMIKCVDSAYGNCLISVPVWHTTIHTYILAPYKSMDKMQVWYMIIFVFY
jgi:hypothetical protein